ncbi:hypothetical protein [Burkholderia sp. MSMB1078WGS]|uniref:hypothetical protein n=1 Tax=Burkholderia sp. MSMB1078WGS TaxID=1637900 RepID=UPI000AA61A16|nr:hypothetical protein [Burkholderia sp. MSMB1078WGS]
MSRATTHRILSIRLFRKNKRETNAPNRKCFGPVDIAAILAILTLILCEFLFPLADKDFDDQASRPLVTLKLLSTPAVDAMDRFHKARAEFYRNTMGHTRDIGTIGADADYLLGLQLQYLSYYRVASIVLIDEMNHIEMLGSDIPNLDKLNSTKNVLSSLKEILALQPKLNECIQTAFTQQQAIDAPLRKGPTDSTRTSLMISTLNTLPDLIRDKTAHWLQCQNNLLEFDQRLNEMTIAYPSIVEQLESRSEQQRKTRTVMRWIATLLLFYCGRLYRRRWMEAASSTLGG